MILGGKFFFKKRGVHWSVYASFFEPALLAGRLAGCVQFNLKGATILNSGTTTSKNAFVLKFCILKVPYILPMSVISGHQEVYWWRCRGSRTGCLPTTPGPSTSRSIPFDSWMYQCRRSSCTVSGPKLSMVMW